jgi:hypothetical protein
MSGHFRIRFGQKPISEQDSWWLGDASTGEALRLQAGACSSQANLLTISDQRAELMVDPSAYFQPVRSDPDRRLDVHAKDFR